MMRSTRAYASGSSSATEPSALTSSRSTLPTPACCYCPGNCWPTRRATSSDRASVSGGGCTRSGPPGSTLDRETLVQQTDTLIRDVVQCCEGPLEVEIVMALIRLRDDITGRVDLGDDWGTLIADSRAKVEQLVNKFFKAKLLGIPDVVEFLDSLGEQ